MLRAAGVYGRILSNKGKKSIIKIKKYKYLINKYCIATVGRLFTLYLYDRKKYLLAGVLRNKGIRPHVRGKAMNPIDYTPRLCKGKATSMKYAYNRSNVSCNMKR